MHLFRRSLALSAELLHANPLPFDYRCGAEISLPGDVPAQGWTQAADGLLPRNGGNPCWLRIEASRLGTNVLLMQGAPGRKAVTLFDSSGHPLAEAHDLGERHQVIVGAGEGRGSMMFPTLVGQTGTLYARVDRLGFRVRLQAVDLSAEIQADRDRQFVNVALSVAYALFALLAAALAVVNRDRGQWVFALYFGVLTFGPLVSDSVALAMSPPFPGFLWWDTAFVPLVNATSTWVMAIALRLDARVPQMNHWVLATAALFFLETPLWFIRPALGADVNGAIALLYYPVAPIACRGVWRQGFRIGAVMAALVVLDLLTYGAYYSARALSYFIPLDAVPYGPPAWLQSAELTSLPLVFLGMMTVRARDHLRGNRQLREESGKFLPAMGLALLLIFLVLAAQFNSFRDPLVILAGSVPLGGHHIGTTRMAATARDGVVDRNCALFELPNLFVAGSAVFSTSSHANPTLTIVAFAVRLAAYLKKLAA